MAKSRKPKAFPKAQVSAGMRRAIENTPEVQFDLACALPSALTILAGLATIQKHYRSLYSGLECEKLHPYAMLTVEPCLQTPWYARDAKTYVDAITQRDPSRLSLLANTCLLLHPAMAYMPRAAWAFSDEMLGTLRALCNYRTSPELREVVSATLQVQVCGCIEPDPACEPGMTSVSRSVWMIRQYWNEIRDTAMFLSDCRVNLVPSPFTELLVSAERRIERAALRLPIAHPLVARVGDMRKLISTMLSGDDSLARQWRDWTYPFIQQIEVDVERASTPLACTCHKRTGAEDLFLYLFRNVRQKTKAMERAAYSEIRSGKVKGVAWEADVDRKLAELCEREEALKAVNIATRAGAAVSDAASLSSHPVVNVAEFTIAHGDKVCYVGNSQALRIAACLVAARGRFVSHRSLVEAVWGVGADTRSEGTIRTAISRLRVKLRASGLAEIVIDGNEVGHYRLYVQDSQM